MEDDTDSLPADLLYARTSPSQSFYDQVEAEFDAQRDTSTNLKDKRLVVLIHL